MSSDDEDMLDGSAVPSAAFQGILHRLSAGLDDLLASSGRGNRFKKILKDLKDNSDDQKQMVALIELNEILVIAPEDVAAMINIEAYVRVLCGLLNKDYNPDLMLMSARALTHLIEMTPAAGGSIISGDYVSLLCSKLLNIEYIDLAEQCLEALEKLSKTHPRSVLQGGGTMAALAYLDFFAAGVQRVALSLVANCCRQVSPSSASFALEGVPTLSNVLAFDDAKLVDLACVCFYRLSASFSDSLENLSKIREHGMIKRLLHILCTSGSDDGVLSRSQLNSNNGGGNSSSNTPIPCTTFSLIVGTLIIHARSSAEAAECLLDNGIVDIVFGIVGAEALSQRWSVNSTSNQTLVRSADQLREILTLMEDLLPRLLRLPNRQITQSLTAIVSMDADDGSPNDAPAVSGPSPIPYPAEKRKKTNDSPPEVNYKSVVSSSGSDVSNEMLTLSDVGALNYLKSPVLLSECSLNVLGPVMEIYISSVAPGIRSRCLSIIIKCIYFLSAAELSDMLRPLPFSSFLATLMQSKNIFVVSLALQTANILMIKLPAIFRFHLLREGFAEATLQLLHAGVGEDYTVGPAVAIDNTASTSSLFLLQGASLLDASMIATNRSTSSSVSSRPQELRLLVAQQATRFCERYFPEIVGSTTIESRGTPTLRALKHLASLLPSSTNPDGIFMDICSLLTSDEGVSNFEFLSSDLIVSILNFLKSNTFEKQRILKLKAFCAAFYPIVKSETDNSEYVPMKDPAAISLCFGRLAAFINRLQRAVDAKEDFLIVFSDTSAAPTPGLKALMHPFKLRLSRADGELAVKDYSGSVILIEPLATIGAIEEFLWTRVKRDDNNDETPIEEKASENNPSLNSLGDKNSGRSPDRRQMSLQSKQKLVMSLNGHVLPASINILKAVQLYSAASSASGGAAAAAAPSPSDAADDRPVAITRNLWDEIHIIKYKLVTGVEASPVRSPLLVARASGMSSLTSPEGMPLRLDTVPNHEIVQLSLENALDYIIFGENQSPKKLPKSVSLDLGNVLELLRIVYCLNNKWFYLCQGCQTNDEESLLPMDAFINSRLAAKLCRQLMDPLTLCTGGLPSWCHDLVHYAPFLFPFDIRRLYFQYTSLGISRALHHMQERAQLDGQNTERQEFRLGRIHRQKARVSRDTILNSAVKVLEFAAGQKSILEIEYYGEAGTGLGPTLEFYTLVSRETQRQDLHVWHVPDLVVEEVIDGKTAVTPSRHALENVLLPPCEPTRIASIHGIAILRCPACYYVHFPVCSSHGVLFTAKVKDDHGQCELCSENTSTYDSCMACDAPWTPTWWAISDEEAKYLSKAFPPSYEILDHLMLQCPFCRSVNFPGTEQALTVNRQGKMFSVTGRRLHESDYRSVTQHLTSLCENSELEGVPIRINQKMAVTLSEVIEGTPALIDGGALMMDASSIFPKTTPLCPGHYIVAPGGLFPAPLAHSDTQNTHRVLDFFRFLGKFVGKAIQDNRLLDMQFSSAFIKLVFSRQTSMADLAQVDPRLAKTLLQLSMVADMRRDILANTALNPLEKQKHISALRIRDATIDDLCLDYTLPGYPSIELVANGRDVPVTLENLQEYIDRICKVFMLESVQGQIREFREGFESVLPMTNLAIFSEEEICMLISGGSTLDLDESGFIDVIRADHGYTKDSPAIRFLAKFVTSLDPCEFRLFLRFVTGTPRLPVGGIGALSPPLTVVRRPPDAGMAPDDYLPSVMTCQNFLKLPDFSTFEIHRKKMLIAMHEGHLSFHLS